MPLESLAQNTLRIISGKDHVLVDDPAITQSSFARMFNIPRGVEQPAGPKGPDPIGPDRTFAAVLGQVQGDPWHRGQPSAYRAAAASRSTPVLGTAYPTIASPFNSSGTPITAASATDGTPDDRGSGHEWCGLRGRVVAPLGLLGLTRPNKKS
jgi:hypothetical protein